MKRSILFMIVLLMCACSEADRQHVISPEHIKNKIRFNDLKFVKMETNPDIILGSDIALKISDDMFFILDRDFQKCVLCFDKNGTFRSKIGRIGKGPGEYTGIYDFLVFNDQVEILSGSGDISKIYRYNLAGQFLKEVTLPYAAFSFVKISEEIYAIGTGYNKTIHTHRIYIIDTEGKEIAMLSPFQTDIDIPVIENTFAGCGKKVFYRESFNNKVYSLEENQLTPNYEFDFGKYNIPADFYSTDILKGFEMIRKKGFSTIIQYFNNQIHAFFEIRQQKEGEESKLHLVLINIKNNTKSILSFGEEITLFRNPAGMSENDELIFLVYPFDLINNPKEIQQYSISQVLKNIDMAENPYIMFCRINK